MKLGEDVRIAPEAIIRYPDLATIGNRVAVDEFTLVTSRLQLGSYVHIAPHCTIIGGRNSCLIMEDCSGIAAGCRIICSSDDFTGPHLINPMVPEKYRLIKHSTVRICRFATLGTNVVVLPGITIGEGAVVAAGGIVTKDLEPWGIYAGAPVRLRGHRPSQEILAMAEELLGPLLEGRPLR